MMRRIFVTSLFAFALLGINFKVAFAQMNTDWSNETSQKDKIIAIQPKTGKTVYGKLISVNNNEIVVQIADKKELTSENLTFNELDVKKVWNAELRFGQLDGKNVAIGAGVGAGIGFGLALLAVVAAGGSDSTGELVAIPTVAGAGAGAGLAALFSRKNHKKLDLLYSRK